MDQPGLRHRGQRQHSLLEVERPLLLVPLQVHGDDLRPAGVTVGGGAVEQHVVAVRSAGGVVFGERDEHVLVHGDLTVEIEVDLLIGLEFVQFEVDFRDALPGGRRFGGGQQGPFGGGQRRCAAMDGQAPG